jgi:hypothetical protein
MPRKVCFVGTTPTGLSAPYHDPSWEIWGVSSRAHYVTRADRWYEIHRLDGTFDKPDEADKWRATLAKMTEDVGALHMIFPEPALHKNVKQIDYHRLERRFGGYHLTSTFAWMWAELLDEVHPGEDKVLGPAPEGSELMICGVEMEHGTEYSHQKPAMRHFIDLAESHGWKVHRLVASSFAYEPVPYPFWQDDPLLNWLEREKKKALNGFKTRDDMLRQVHEGLAKNRAKQEFIAANYTEDVDAKLADLRSQEDALVATSIQIAKEVLQWQAVMEANAHFIGWLQP